MRRIPLLLLAIFALVGEPALAQAPAPASTPVRVRGTVEKLDGNTLVVKARDGQSLTIALGDNYAVSALTKKTVADIKPNDYIACTAVKGTDGKLHSVELRIFPEALRGTAEGQFPWDSMPDAVMTNATVAGVVAAGNGHTIKVTYKGQDSELVIDPNSPVFAYIPGDPSLLKPGAAVFTVAQKKPDGTLTATRITAEKDGVKPPM